MKINNSLENIANQRADEINDSKDLKEIFKYTIPASILVAGFYLAGHFLHDSEKDRITRKIVDEARIIELAHPVVGYMQLFMAENVGYDFGLLDRYRQKIMELNPNYQDDLLVRKAIDLNNDGRIGE